jgi:hypothetical protein
VVFPAKWAVRYRISGHETFPCRYTWLPKAARHIKRNPKLFGDEQQAMVDLGVGKNMVRSIRFWSQAAEVISPNLQRRGHSLTKIGSHVLGHGGADEFLEDVRTLWLIHWKLSTSVDSPLLAWDYLLNRADPEIIPSIVFSELEKEAAKYEDKLSPATLRQHLEAFLHTYVPTRGRKGEIQEDNLDCPLVELELLMKIGDREVDPSVGRREAIFVFRREAKPEITPELFAYCLADFWEKRHEKELTLPFREVAHGHASPGQIFKLVEEDIRIRLEGLSHQKNPWLDYKESATLQQLHRRRIPDQISLLKQIHSPHETHA